MAKPKHVPSYEELKPKYNIEECSEDERRQTTWHPGIRLYMHFVCKAIDKSTGKVYELHTIRQGDCERDFMRNIHMLLKVNHPNILNLFEIYESRDWLYVVVEPVTGKKVLDRIVAGDGSYTEKDASEIIKQVLEAVDYLHSQGIAFRSFDIEDLNHKSPDKGSQIVIRRFNFSRIDEPEPHDRSNRHWVYLVYRYSPYYQPPEFSSIALQKPISKSADCWAIGVTTYILLSGCYPFLLSYEPRDSSKIFNSLHWENLISDSAKDFISKLLDVNVESRYSCCQAIEHPWISGGIARTHENLRDPVKEGMKVNEYKTALSMWQDTTERWFDFREWDFFSRLTDLNKSYKFSPEESIRMYDKALNEMKRQGMTVPGEEVRRKFATETHREYQENQN